MLGIYELRKNLVTMSLTRHTDAYPVLFHKHVEIMYVIEGSVDMRIDGIDRTLEKGELSITYPYTIHNSQETCATILLLIFDPSICNDFLPFFSDGKPVNPYLAHDMLNPIIPDMLGRMLEIFNENDRCSETALRSYINAFMSELFRVLEFTPIVHTDLDAVQKILRYCSRNYKDYDISIRSISSALHFSKSHITYIFANKINTNLRDYINRLRMHDTKKLLETTDMKILDVMLECGFSNQSTFNRVFYEFFGMSPKDYRNQLKETLADKPKDLIF